MNEIIETLDWDYIRYTVKKLLREEITRQSIIGKTHRNKSDVKFCIENDFCLCLHKRLLKNDEVN